ncbi:hypothetical protein MHK_006115, partial [Candidatus Magnetomorum sp. HK-1]
MRLNNRIAISPSVIKKIAVKISELLDQYQEEQQAKHKIDEPLKIIGGIDETYFENMILVLMDLSSGYIFVE